MYACPYCNGAKSDDWPSGNEQQTIAGNEGYVDPCDSHYDEHFKRYEHGRIRPKTPLGKYMFKRLKLGLQRHQLAWAYAYLGELLQEFTEYLNEFEEEDPLRQKLLNHHLKLTTAFLKYKNMFEQTI